MVSFREKKFGRLYVELRASWMELTLSRSLITIKSQTVYIIRIHCLYTVAYRSIIFILISAGILTELKDQLKRCVSAINRELFPELRSNEGTLLSSHLLTF